MRALKAVCVAQQAQGGAHLAASQRGLASKAPAVRAQLVGAHLLLRLRVVSDE